MNSSFGASDAFPCFQAYVLPIFLHECFTLPYRLLFLLQKYLWSNYSMPSTGRHVLRVRVCRGNEGAEGCCPGQGWCFLSLREHHAVRERVKVAPRLLWAEAGLPCLHLGFDLRLLLLKVLDSEVKSTCRLIVTHTKRTEPTGASLADS